MREPPFGLELRLVERLPLRLELRLELAELLLSTVAGVGLKLREAERVPWTRPPEFSAWPGIVLPLDGEPIDDSGELALEKDLADGDATPPPPPMAWIDAGRAPVLLRVPTRRVEAEGEAAEAESGLAVEVGTAETGVSHSSGPLAASSAMSSISPAAAAGSEKEGNGESDGEGDADESGVSEPLSPVALSSSALASSLSAPKPLVASTPAIPRSTPATAAPAPDTASTSRSRSDSRMLPPKPIEGA